MEYVSENKLFINCYRKKNVSLQTAQYPVSAKAAAITSLWKLREIKQPRCAATDDTLWKERAHSAFYSWSLKQQQHLSINLFDCWVHLRLTPPVAADRRGELCAHTHIQQADDPLGKAQIGERFRLQTDIGYADSLIRAQWRRSAKLPLPIQTCASTSRFKNKKYIYI